MNHLDHLRTFIVVPALPEPLDALREIAYNLWWTWNPQAREVFRRLDVDLWEQVNHNPVAMLWSIRQDRLERAARDDAYLAQLKRVHESLKIYLQARTWFDEQHPQEQGCLVAYFSAEFGLHECLPIYSGGLGVLAGDHLKAASGTGIPLVGVGLAYRQGYFEQQLTEDGWQLESYPSRDFHQWPATRMEGGDGKPLMVSVSYGGPTIQAQVWHVAVGRVHLYLLDADIPENPPELRNVTARLYGGDHRMRIRQEILLGIGGLRALAALGIKPTVFHMNEGHAAFLALERIRLVMKEQGLNYEEARAAVSAGNIFTTHTPVPAGIDRFDPSLVREHLGWMAREIGLSNEDFLALGRENDDDDDNAFCMPILALRTSFKSNAVSKLHAEVARSMWQSIWPNVPEEEIPIVHVTNGIHTRSWVSAPMAELFDHYLGPQWAEDPRAEDVWRRIDEIPDAELWSVHVRRREHLIGIIRRRLKAQLKRRGAAPAEVKAADEVLDPEALTIGFARRFAPYKRATLLIRNPERLSKLIRNSARPVQFLFAGKAHPADSGGKELIKQLSAICSRAEFRRRMVFLENYDMRLARVLVQGCDVWLNNPLRLHEASGTSGMKVPANGGLNLSCLDGWWPEAFNGKNGWAIGDGRVYDDLAYQDHVESESLYNLLEREIIPLFYDRSSDDLPREWIARVKNSMKTICPQFNTIRMLREYGELMYVPAFRRGQEMVSNEYAVARRLTGWRREIREHWHQVRILRVTPPTNEVHRVGDAMPIEATLHLGAIKPGDVTVEVYCGPVNANGEIERGKVIPMRHAGEGEPGQHRFSGTIQCETSGHQGYAVRVAPCSEDLASRYDQDLVVWG